MALPSPLVVRTDLIRAKRIALKLSMASAAEAAGLSSRQAWHRIEQSADPNVTIHTLRDIARVLKCKVSELIKD